MSRITPGQMRAARGLIGWSQADLASKSNVARATIADFEAGKREPYDRTLDDLRAALEAGGVEFTNGGQPGVRMKADPTWGYVYDDRRIVGLVKDGEFRADTRERELIALVKNGSLHDPSTGERLCGLTELGTKGEPLPSVLRARMPT